MFMDKKFLKMRDGAELYVQIKESGSPVWIIATHGVGEHMDRHKYIPELFGHDFNVFQYDLRGHGRSTGKKAYIEDFSLYMEDLLEITRFLKEKYRMDRYVLFGHSMGGLITCAFIQNYVDSNIYPERLIVNAPPVGADGFLGTLVKVLPTGFFNTMGNLPYTFPIGGLVDLKYLSHDPRVKEEYIKDPLNSLKLESKLMFEIMKTVKSTFARPLRSTCPSYVSVGSADHVVGSKDLIEYFTTVDKSFQLKVFDGSYHEIHNEIEKYRKPYFEHLKAAFNEVLFKPV
ncbi:MAG: alpha/beta fold hydrolase [Rhizobacter sp.]|nr:alpha/beta fold hydrolase [Bacteriovorax sp.]